MFYIVLNQKTRVEMLDDLYFRNYLFRFLHKNGMVVNENIPDNSYWFNHKIYHINDLSPLKKHLSLLKWENITKNNPYTELA